MNQRVYIETSVVSYLTGRPSRDLIIAGHQALTQEWWATQRSRFELVSSQAVLEEISAGDPDQARQRLEVLATMPLLAVTEEAESLARKLIVDKALPAKAYYDALHIALSAVHGVEFLMTWNCKHIANATMRPAIERFCRLAGYEPPVLSTPEELIHG